MNVYHKTLPSILPLFLGMFLLGIDPGAVSAQSGFPPSKIIEAEGRAAASSITARNEALARALRNAVEQGVGIIIDSVSMTENFRLIEDKIYSEVKGFVENYTILFENPNDNGFFVIRLQAQVALGMLQNRLAALNLLREKKGNPRIMIIASELIDGLEQAGAVVSTEIESLFLSKNFPLVDKSQMEMIKQRDASMAYANPQKAVALGRRYGAELVIVVQATSDLVDTSQPYGQSVFYYGSQCSAKAIKVDTAQIVASESVTIDRVGGGGRIPTAKKSLAQAGQRLAGTLLSKIIESWQSEVYNTVRTQLILSNASLGRSLKLQNALDGLPVVINVYEKSLVNGVLELDVELKGASTDELAIRLLELSDILISITGKSENRIDGQFIN